MTNIQNVARSPCPASRAMINLYLHSPDGSMLDFETKIKCIPLYLQKRILRKKLQQKREDSLLAYLLLQLALEKDFDLNLEQMSFLESGKPVFKDKPISFNISHSNNKVGVVISQSGEVGLDIQAFRKFEPVEVAFSFFSLIEQQTILADALPERKLIEFWSKKEAFIKAIGGKMFDMASRTDVRFSSIQHFDKPFFFHEIKEKFDGFIWVASSFSTNNIVVKEIKTL